MKKITRLLAMLMALTLCLTASMSALAETTDAPATQEAAAAEAASIEETAAVEGEAVEGDIAAESDTVLATVNGKDLMLSEVDNYAYQLMYYFYSYGYDITDASLAAYIKKAAVEGSIQNMVLFQKADELGFGVLTAEEEAQAAEAANTDYEANITSWLDSNGTLTDTSTDEEKAAARETAIAALEAEGYTMDYILTYQRENIIYDKIYADMVKDAAVTDADVQAAFDEKVASDQAQYSTDVGTYEYMTGYYGQTSYYRPEGYRGVIHILLDVDDDLLSTYQALTAQLEEQQDNAEKTGEDAAAMTTDETAAEATAEPEATSEPVTQEQVDAAEQAIIASVQSTIDEINQKLADGVSFADLAKEYSTDPGMQKEENLTNGYNVHMDSILWDPAFVKAAFSLDTIGQVSAPFVGNYGVYIVSYLRDVPSGAVELTDEIRATLTESLMSTAENNLFSTVLQGWTAEADVTYTEAGIAYTAEATTATDDASAGDETDADTAAEATEVPAN